MAIKDGVAAPIDLLKSSQNVAKTTQTKVSKLDERFQNLIRTRDRRLAWILLALFCILMLVASRLSYWMVGFPSTTLMQHLSSIIIGMLIGLTCLISVWTTLGEGSLIRRIIFLACSAAAIFAAWMLGLVASFYPESVMLSGREEVYALGLLPTVFLTLCLPLTISPSVFGLVLADQQNESPVKAPITTVSLMTVTAIVGCCLGGIRWFMTISEEGIMGIASGIAIMSGVSFLVGLLTVVPAVLFLCSRRRSFLFFSMVLMTAGSLLIWLIIVGIFAATGAWISSQDVLSILEGTFAATVTFTVGIGIIRMFGYRLAKERLAKEVG